MIRTPLLMNALTIFVLTSMFLAPLQVDVVFAAPRNNGSGHCWGSGASWTGYTVIWQRDSTIPSSWLAPIVTAHAIDG
jgi:hypothetical protein